MTVSIKCTGIVQGVFYRATTKEKALMLGIKGWVKNLSDGSVLINAYGSEDVIKSLIKWCGEGPVLAKVKEVRVTEIEFDEEIATKLFEIVY